jgi:hypothetical protein
LDKSLVDQSQWFHIAGRQRTKPAGAGSRYVSPALYQIDPTTGVATQIGPTYLYLDASIKLDGTLYAFLAQLTGFPGGFPAAFTELEKVDVTTGAVTFLRVVDVSAGVIFGASDTSDWEFGGR